jgi:rsbT co-antagonist protein RsbR
MQRVIDELRRRAADLTTESVDRVKAAGIPFYEKFPREIMHASIGKVFESVILDIERKEVAACPKVLAALGTQRAPAGVSLRDMLRGMEIGFEVASAHFKEFFREDVAAQLFWERWRCDLSYASAMALSDTYVAARERLIAQQSEQILRLSAPLVPLARGVLLLPLVGAVTEARASQIVGSVLEATGRHGARSIIIDITGVPVAEAGVAGYLAQAAQAARLMGAQIILVGVSPAMAQAFVELRVNLGSVPTLGDLESGIAYALRLQGLAIRKAT